MLIHDKTDQQAYRIAQLERDLQRAFEIMRDKREEILVLKQKLAQALNGITQFSRN